jgi:hypothetical protein
MFITKHLLALVALPVGAASSCDVCSKKLYEFSQCGFFNQEAKGKFDDWKYPTIANQTIGSDDCHSDHCCASDKDDCCEANVGAIVGLVVAIVLFVAMCCYLFAPGESILAYCQNDETSGVPPDSIKLENCRRIHAPMRDWYAAPAQRSLRAKHGNFPRDPEALNAWSSYDAVVTAFLDSAPGRENDSV